MLQNLLTESMEAGRKAVFMLTLKQNSSIANKNKNSFNQNIET